MQSSLILANQALNLAKELFPLNRSLVNSDTSKTIDLLLNGFDHVSSKEHFLSGTKFGAWEIPDAWEVQKATLTSLSGEEIVDWKRNNLHLMSYSVSIKTKISHAELLKHIHFDESKPNWIPYRTSYYERDWAFCVSKKEYEKLIHSDYIVDIQTSFKKSKLEIGEIVLKGISKKEIVFTTYVCHPSMANNEISGPVVMQALAKYIQSKPDRYYTYRFIFMPETIGAIAYLGKNYPKLKEFTLAGFVVSCMGDSRAWGYIASRTGNTLADKVSRRVLTRFTKEFNSYSFTERGSDERQFCSPAANLPFCGLTRSKYGTYPEYHTSGDDLSLFSVSSLMESIEFFIEIFCEFETNKIYYSSTLGEPFFKKYNMRGTVGGSTLDKSFSLFSNLVAYSDKSNDTAEISTILDLEHDVILNAYLLLEENKIVEQL
jgi:aminopeptidase-like protein